MQHGVSKPAVLDLLPSDSAPPAAAPAVWSPAPTVQKSQTRRKAIKQKLMTKLVGNQPQKM